jgi:hypothetical protein
VVGPVERQRALVRVVLAVDAEQAARALDVRDRTLDGVEKGEVGLPVLGFEGADALDYQVRALGDPVDEPAGIREQFVRAGPVDPQPVQVGPGVDQRSLRLGGGAQRRDEHRLALAGQRLQEEFGLRVRRCSKGDDVPRGDPAPGACSPACPRPSCDAYGSLSRRVSNPSWSACRRPSVRLSSADLTPV